MSHGVDGTSLFFPCVAVALWIIHFASGQGWPAEPPSLVAWLFVLIAAAAIGGGYACWGYGILHGSMERLAIASYATPVLSTGASAVLLGWRCPLRFGVARCWWPPDRCSITWSVRANSGVALLMGR